jgi:hypothetical protein
MAAGAGGADAPGTPAAAGDAGADPGGAGGMLARFTVLSATMIWFATNLEENLIPLSTVSFSGAFEYVPLKAVVLTRA